MDELAVAYVDAGVGAGLAGVAAGIVEEHQVTGLQGTDAPDLGAQSALPLAGGGVRQGVAVLLVDIHGEAGAVKAAGRSAAVHIAHAQIALGGVHDGAAGGRSGGLGQVQEITADIALGAVFAGDVIPAVHQTVDGDDGVGVHGGQHFALCGGAGTNIHAVAVDPAVRLKDVVLIHQQIVGGDIARVALVGDLVPAFGGVIQNGHGHALVQRGHDIRGSGRLSAQTQGRTGGAAGADGHVGGHGVSGQQQSGGEGQEKELCCLACKVCHGWSSFRFFCVGEGSGREKGVISPCRPGHDPARWRPRPWRHTGCLFRSF